jgi:GTPase SAR1 family protein
VGKTSLVNRVTAGVFDERYLTTVGLRVERMRLQAEGREIELGLWDLAGGMENRTLVRSGYTGAAGVFIVIDPCRPGAVRAAGSYAAMVAEILPTALCYWVFNKADLRQAWLAENAPELLQGVSYFITSARTGEGVEEAFREMARGMISRSVLVASRSASN